MMLALAHVLFPLALIVVPLATLAGALGVLALRRWPAVVATLGVAVAWVGAIATFAAVCVTGAQRLPLLEAPFGGVIQPLLGLYADRLVAALLVLVTTVSLATHIYARRAMLGEPRYAVFFARLSLVTALVTLVLLSDTLIMLFIFWALKGLTLATLLSHYRDVPAARAAGRAKFVTDLVGDGAFLLALGLAWTLFGTFSLGIILARAPQVAVQHGATLTVVALLLTVAAMAKSALVPLQEWLPRTVEAPTPVSALMHAGLINAGGFLLARLSPLFVAAPVALWVTAAVGAATMLFGTLVMLTRSDIKTQLAYSTMGQMGFMALECGLGAFALAILHLIAHGFFKALLFLRSGQAVEDVSLTRRLSAEVAEREHDAIPAPAVAVALLAPLGALAAYAALAGLPRGGLTILWLFAWLTAAQALGLILRRWSMPRLLIGVAVLGALTLYLAGAAAVETFLAPDVAVAPAPPLSLTTGLIVGIVALGLATFGLKGRTGRAASGAVNALYIASLRGFYVEDAWMALAGRLGSRGRASNAERGS